MLLALPCVGLDEATRCQVLSRVESTRDWEGGTRDDLSRAIELVGNDSEEGHEDLACCQEPALSCGGGGGGATIAAAAAAAAAGGGFEAFFRGGRVGDAEEVVEEAMEGGEGVVVRSFD